MLVEGPNEKGIPRTVRGPKVLSPTGGRSPFGSSDRRQLKIVSNDSGRNSGDAGMVTLRGSPRLTGREQEVDIAAVSVEIDDHAAQDVGGVVAARVQAHRLSDLLCPAGFMDVAVKAHDGLILLNRVANRLAANRDDAWPT